MPCGLLYVLSGCAMWAIVCVECIYMWSGCAKWAASGLAVGFIEAGAHSLARLDHNI